MTDFRPLVCTLRDAGILVFPTSATAKHPDRGITFADPDGKRIPRWAPEYYPPNGWPTAAQHELMFRGRDVARLFVVCGARSRNIIAFDFDRAGVFEQWSAIVFPYLLTWGYHERSQRSGGFHFAARLFEPVASSVPARTAEGKVAIEVRGEGNGFIAAPSLGYERVHGDLTDLPVFTAGEYQHLLAAAATFNAYTPPKPPPPPPRPPRPHPAPPGTARECRDGERPGDRYNRTHGQAEVVTLLEKHGWQVVGYGRNATHVLRPGDTDSTHSGSVNTDGVLIVFSTSTPFAATAQGDAHPYSPFEVFAVLEHDGDFAAAARALSRAGYGNRRPVAPSFETIPTISSSDDAVEAILAPHFVTAKEAQQWLS